MLKLLELFGGIGACSRALDHLGIEYEIADYVEIDKYAVKSYNAIHNTNFKPQDIKEWNKDIEVDLIMHGSPCQDFSTAGKNRGGDEGSGTRSSLMYETIRIIEKLKPKYVIWENVKNLISEKHRHNFSKYLRKLEQLGYVSNYKVLNSKDYGIPQNRERIFTISIRNDIKWEFTFPPKEKLKLRLRDLLEKEVDEKYFLSDKMMQYISANNEKWSGNNEESTINKSVATTINTGEGHRICDASNYVSDDVADDFDLKQVKLLGGIGEKDSNGGTQWKNQNRIYSSSSSSPSIETCFHPFISLDDEKVKKIGGLYGNHQAGSIFDDNGISPTLDTMGGGNRMPFVAVNKHLKETIENNELKDGMFIDGYNRKVNEEIAGTIDNGVNFRNDKYLCVKNATQKGFLEAQEGDGIDISSRMATHRGTVQKDMAQTINTQQDGGVVVLGNYSPSNHEASRIVDKNGLAPTIKENHGTINAVNDLRIRKLTPLECWRLMAFDDEAFYKASQVNSNAQLYKQAGNSIVVKVLERILENLLITEVKDIQLNIFDMMDQMEEL